MPRALAGSLLRQFDRACFRIRILAIEERGVSHGADTDAATFVSDLFAERGAFVAIGTEETQLHKLVSAEELLQLGEEFRGESAATDFESVVERLPEATQVGLLGAGEREFVHQSANDANRRG